MVGSGKNSDHCYKTLLNIKKRYDCEGELRGAGTTPAPG